MFSLVERAEDMSERKCHAECVPTGTCISQQSTQFKSICLLSGVSTVCHFRHQEPKTTAFNKQRHFSNAALDLSNPGVRLPSLVDACARTGLLQILIPSNGRWLLGFLETPCLGQGTTPCHCPKEQSPLTSVLINSQGCPRVTSSRVKLLCHSHVNHCYGGNSQLGHFSFCV